MQATQTKIIIEISYLFTIMNINKRKFTFIRT